MDNQDFAELVNERVGTLVEALPYIREFSGKTIVVKYGGAAMTDPELKRAVMKDLVLMHYVGVHVVLVHGGGPKINEMLGRLGEEPEFVNGLRVTGKSTMDIVEMVLVGHVGQSLVSLLNAEGGRAVGLSGRDARVVRACKLKTDQGDLGYVGEVVEIDTSLINTLNQAGYIVVLTPVGSGESCVSYNINADTVACAVAAALKAEKLIILSDVPGIMRDPADPDSLISAITTADADALIDEGVVTGGMIPKVGAAVNAIEDGVKSVHMIDGRMEHSLLMELFTSEGVGTMITGEEGASCE